MKEYKEEEVIQLGIQLGLTTGNELETKNYKKNGYIPMGKELDAFIEKMLCGFETVELKLNPKSNKGKGDKPYGGKRRIYLLGKQREKFIKRVDNRVNSGVQSVGKHEENLLKATLNNLQSNYLMYQEHTLSHWANNIGLLPLDWITDTEIYNEKIEVLNDLFKLDTSFASFYQPDYILKHFINDYNFDRRQKVVLRMFEWLQKQGSIEYEVKYYAQNGTEKQEVSKEIYNSYFEELRGQIFNRGYTYNEYRRHLNYLLKQRKLGKRLTEFYDSFKLTVQNIENYIQETLGFTYAFQTVRLTFVESNDNAVTISNDTMWKYYLEYLVPNTKRYRHKIKANQDITWSESPMFHRAFYYLAVSALANDIDQEELKNFEQDLIMFMKRNYVEYHVPFKTKTNEELIKDEKILKEAQVLIDRVLVERQKLIDAKVSSYEYYQRQTEEDLQSVFEQLDDWAQQLNT